MTIIHAIFENGVFRPVEPVSLPERSKVEVHVPTVAVDNSVEASTELFDILSRTYETGQTNTAEKHNEHQP